MKKWIDYFLNGVSQMALLSVANRLHRPICRDFSKHLETLKKNIITTKYIDPYEFYDLSLDEVYQGRSGQEKYLNRIRRGMDRLAELPIGRQIMSGVDTSTYFSSVPMDVMGRFYIRDCQYIFLNPIPKVFRSINRVSGILIHEMTHAKNAQMFGETCGYQLPPRLYFMQRIMNEMSARFSECVMAAQLNNKNAKKEDVLTDAVLFETYDEIVSKCYIEDFTEDTICRYKSSVAKKEPISISNKHLEPFAYYFMLYPVLKNRALIENMYQLYNRHVVKKVEGNRKASVCTNMKRQNEKE